MTKTASDVKSQSLFAMIKLTNFDITDELIFFLFMTIFFFPKTEAQAVYDTHVLEKTKARNLINMKQEH